MLKEQQAVGKFMVEKCRLTIPEVPTMPTAEMALFRIALIQEELSELQWAFHKRDMVEVADALGDLLYVVLGAFNTCGISSEEIFWEIQRSNMTKDPSDGHFKACVKGERFKAPDIAMMLELIRQRGAFVEQGRRLKELTGTIKEFVKEREKDPTVGNKKTPFRYVCGFYFSCNKVLLIKKLHPDWQKNKYNGVGGLIEQDETAEQAMEREFEEEAGRRTKGWTKLITLHGVDDSWQVEFFYMRGDYFTPKKAAEQCSWHDLDDGFETIDTIRSLDWLIPMAHYFLKYTTERID